MKRTLLSILTIAALTGCARFSTVQTDTTYAVQTNGVFISSAPLHRVTTKVRGSSFWDANNQLSNFKASQTEKTQGASVGSVNQTSTSTNVNALASAIVEGAVKGAMQFK